MTETDEIRMRQYLLGELSAVEQQQLEERYFSDPRVFEQLTQLETRLLDDYSRGRLSAELRTQLEQAYLKNPNRRARLQMSQALVARVDQDPGPVWAEAKAPDSTSVQRGVVPWVARRHGSLRFALAAAILVLSFATVWLFVENQRLRQDAARIREAKQQLARERDRNQQLTAELEHARAGAQFEPPPGPSSVASLILSVGELREPSIEKPPTLVIPHGTTEVRLLLNRSSNEYSSYQVVLQTVAGKEIFHRQHVAPLATKSGVTFTLTFAPSLLSAGDYLLTLRGALPSGELEDVSQSLFRVAKPR